MDYQEKIYNILKSLIESGTVEINKGVKSLSTSDSIEELGMNSITFIKMIIEIEEEFDIEFSEDQLDARSFHTINDIIHAIIEQVEGRFK